MKTILVATDFSESSDMALARGTLLARQTGASLELLHVLEDWPRDEAMDDLCLPVEPLLHQMVKEAEENLEHQVMRTQAADLEPVLTVETGKDFVAIIQRARLVEADLIVVGSHGKGLAQDLFLGTTAEKVVRKGDRPVLMVKRVPERPYRRVLVPSDFSGASRRAFLAALDLAPEAVFDLLHVYRLRGAGRLNMATIGDEVLHRYYGQVLERAENDMTEFLRGIDLGGRPIRRHLRQGHPPVLIPAEAAELQSDLVAMGTEGLSGLPYLLLGSVAEHVMRDAMCDVLAVRPADFTFRLP